ncbi:MAG: alpha/beta hydrolase [Paludibacter sp.]|jgi:acetyl esterase/lipase|nr:alpha/beta hydrolase [Paludibacter sp.]
MKHKLVIAFILLSMGASAQTFTLPVWEGKVPNSNGITEPEITSETGRVSNVSIPQLYVYLPENKPNAPFVIICPGGGYVRLSIDHEGHEVARWLNSIGVAAAVLKYRMPNGHHEVPLSDAQQAIKLVRQNSKKWNIDPKKIGISGFSAGGHLAATAATLFTDSVERPDFAVLFYAVVSMDSTVTHRGSSAMMFGKSITPELIKRYSAEKNVSAATPPTLLFLSDNDRTVPSVNSVEFYKQLKQNNIPASMYVFPVGGHGWGMNTTFRYHEEMKTLFEKWLIDNKILGEN